MASPSRPWKIAPSMTLWVISVGSLTSRCGGRVAAPALAVETWYRSETMRRGRNQAHTSQQKSFNNVISAGKQCRRQFETELLSSFEINEQLNFCGLLDR